MATITQKKRNIKYLNRDFESFKRDLIEYLRVYFPDTIADFNESSVGMMFTEIPAFIGDNLSFYLDKRVGESFTETAREAKMLLKHARQLGFKPFGKTSAVGVIDCYLKVPAITINQNIVPDMRYAGIISRGAKLKSKTGKTYETLIDADFSTVWDGSGVPSPLLVTVADRDATTKQPKTFVLKKTGIDIKAGETKTTTFSIGAYKAFQKLTFADDDVLEILSIIDSERNIWYEVDYLAQDTIFDGVPNVGADATDVPYVLKLRSVPYRFVSEYNIATNKTSMVFGTGDAQAFDGELIPDLGDLALPLYGKTTFTDFTIDPQNFLKTRTLGLAPTNTQLNCSYRVGGGVDTNAGTGEINSVASSVFEIGDSTLDSAIIRDVGNSFSVLNSSPIRGGRDALTLDELRQLIPASFSAQSRVVTTPDFIVRALSMPSRYGSVFRANAKVNSLNNNAVELIVLSRDAAGNVTLAPSDLKNNLKTYLSRFRMMTDAIEILDGAIINISVNFSVLTNPDYNKTEVLANCIDALQDFFKVDTWQLNQPINLTDIYTTLAAIPGVLSVIDVNIINRVGNFEGRSYSNTSFNVKKNTRNGIVYGMENAIFSVQYPTRDIAGVAR